MRRPSFRMAAGGLLLLAAAALAAALLRRNSGPPTESPRASTDDGTAVRAETAARALRRIIDDVSSGPYASEPLYVEYALPAYRKGLAKLQTGATLAEPIPLVAILRRKTADGGHLELAWLETGFRVIGVSLAAEGATASDLRAIDLPPSAKAHFGRTVWRDCAVPVEFADAGQPSVRPPRPGEDSPAMVLPRMVFERPFTVRLLLDQGAARSVESIALYTLDARGKSDNPDER